MDKAIIEKLIEEKMTAPQMAVNLGISVSSVSRLLKKFGLRTKHYCDHRPDAKTRICRYCGDKKKIGEFPIAAISNGQTYRRWKCNKCYVAMKTARKRDIAEWFEELKKGLKCVRCPNEDFRTFEFHHHEDNKEFNISEGVLHGLSKETILAEIAKCEVLCANCHRILHYEERKAVRKALV